MFQKLKDKWLQYVTVVFVSIVVAFFVFVTYPKFQRLSELKARASELDRKIEDEKSDINRLKDYQQRFRTDPAFVEKIARQNHRVYPGELVFVFEED